MTDMMLARTLRQHPVHDLAAVATVRLIVRWDRETGWAHLGVAAPDGDRPRFAGFHRFAGGATEAVVAELTAAGCLTTPAAAVDEGLMEIEAVLACREVHRRAAR